MKPIKGFTQAIESIYYSSEIEDENIYEYEFTGTEVCGITSSGLKVCRPLITQVTGTVSSFEIDDWIGDIEPPPMFESKGCMFFFVDNEKVKLNVD